MSLEQWTLPELVAKVEAELARNYRAPESGQVRAVPDERVVRYYASLGILDKPLAMRGRTALYGVRHLAQLIAVKRLQAQGQSLGQIQAFLPGVDDKTLSRVAGIVLPGASRSQRKDFWRARQGPVLAPAPVGAAVTKDSPRFAIAFSVTLAPGVALSVNPERSLTDADAEALGRAAAPLVAELVRRKLITVNSEPEKTKALVKRRQGARA